MKKLFLLFSIALASSAFAAEEYLSLYMAGSKIGYSSYSTHSDTLGGRKVKRSDSLTKMDAGLLGQSMKMSIEGSTWTDALGKPIRMLFVISSAGRVQKVTAIFTEKTAEIDVLNGTQKTHKSLPLPAGASVVDDPLEVMLEGKSAAGTKKSFYILDPMMVSFIKNEVVVVGKKEIVVRSKKVQATLVRIVDPRMSTDVYVSSKGDLVKVEAPMGIEMYPETREQALKNETVGYKPSADLAFATSIHPDKDISSPESVTGLTIKVTGKDLSRLPSDEHQTVKQQGAAWMLDIHPPTLPRDSATTITAAQGQKPEWVKPSLDIPADSKTFKDLSSSILKGETRVVPAALAIKAYVQKTMRPNAGIGVLRDASEVLASKEGVCRDYAMLTATLMRAAGIPARLCSGVVNWQGDFYYHAWVEIWDGSQWLGIDSTVPQEQMSAAHIKLAQGNVEDAFAFTFLDKVKIEVLDVRRG